MQNQPLLYGIIGLLAGIVIMLLTAQNAVNNNNMGMMQMMGIRSQDQFRCPMEEDQSMGMGSSMEEMMESMEGKSGEALDQAFLSAMIIHHQGAIQMAEQVKDSTQREELRKLANDIISAQTNEIEMMKNWQIQWGY